jgi:serine/threonine-protein kinase RsbW
VRSVSLVTRDDFRMTVATADAAEIGSVRDSLVEWLGHLPLSAERSSDIVLACYEAMANIVEHAYTGSEIPSFEISVANNRLAHRITITIADHGTWRTPDPDADIRGRGLALLTALCDRADVVKARSGTTVLMSWDDPSELAGFPNE